MTAHSTRPPPSATQVTKEGPRIGILERNGAVAQRVARVVRAASALGEVVVEEDPASLRTSLGEDPILLVCDVSDIDLALDWTKRRYPNLAIAAWSSGSMDPLLEAARENSALVSLIGWPSFASMPRPWEIALATRRLTDSGGAAPRLGELFAWGSTVTKYRPKTSAERDAVVAEVLVLSERAGTPPRVAQRVSEVAHEMLMNAMYDAPVDDEGLPLYAHDRKADISLGERDVPTFRFAVDGLHVALQCVDPFGGLRRHHVLDGIIRGRRGGEGDSVLDTSNGGAGLGLYRIYSQSTVMITDVDPGHFTSVTAFFDLDVNPREARTMPVSLHMFESPRA